MKTKLILALGTSIALGALAANAQTTDDTTSAVPAGSLPAEWGDEVRSAFFTDVEQGTLKSEDEIRQGWSALDAEQQASVRLYCDQHDTASADTPLDTGAGSTTGSGTDTSGTAAAPMDDGSASDTTAGATDETMGTSGDTTAGATDETMGTSGETTASTTDSGSATGDMHMASLTELCGMVEGFE